MYINHIRVHECMSGLTLHFTFRFDGLIVLLRIAFNSLTILTFWNRLQLLHSLIQRV